MSERNAARFEVPAADLGRLVHCVVEHAEPADARDVERLLGVLTMLESTTDPERGDVVRFAAPRGTGHLVERALAGMARSDRHDARARRARSLGAHSR